MCPARLPRNAGFARRVSTSISWWWAVKRLVPLDWGLVRTRRRHGLYQRIRISRRDEQQPVYAPPSALLLICRTWQHASYIHAVVVMAQSKTSQMRHA